MEGGSDLLREDRRRAGSGDMIGISLRNLGELYWLKIESTNHRINGLIVDDERDASG